MFVLLSFLYEHAPWFVQSTYYAAFAGAAAAANETAFGAAILADHGGGSSQQYVRSISERRAECTEHCNICGTTAEEAE